MNGYGLGAASESVYCVESPKPIECECGEKYPAFSKDVHGSFVGNDRDGWKANGCIKCKPAAYHREIAQTRSKLRLGQYIAKTQRARSKRIIYRDVAVRYLERFGGKTFVFQTDVDACDIFLENAKGSVIGKVDYRDKYPKPPPPEAFADMPY